MGRIIKLREQEVKDPHGNVVGNITVSVDADVVEYLLQTDVSTWKPGVDVDKLPRGQEHKPKTTAERRGKLKAYFGYTDEDLDVLEKEGVI